MKSIKKCLSDKKECLKKNLVDHPFVTSLGFGFGLLLLGFAILLLLYGFNWLFHRLDCRLILKYALISDDSISTWFSFWGSYLGVVGTVILGLITIRLTLKIEEMNLASELNALYVEKIWMHDLRRDFSPSQISRVGIDRRFVFQIIASKYQPCYEIEVKEVSWGKYEKDGDSEISYTPLGNFTYRVDRKKKFMIMIACEDNEKEEKENTLNYYYRLHAYEPVTMKAKERQRILKIKFCLTSVLNRKQKHQKDKIRMEMECIVENMGYSSKKNGVLLHVLSTQMEFET